MNVLDYTITIRHLRHYYNGVCEIMERMDDGEITVSESEAELIKLDEKYAELITKEKICDCSA